jgi:hypothetical protein
MWSLLSSESHLIFPEKFIGTARVRGMAKTSSLSVACSNCQFPCPVQDYPATLCQQCLQWLILDRNQRTPSRHEERVLGTFRSLPRTVHAHHSACVARMARKGYANRPAVTPRFAALRGSSSN